MATNVNIDRMAKLSPFSMCHSAEPATPRLPIFLLAQRELEVQKKIAAQQLDRLATKSTFLTAPLVF